MGLKSRFLSSCGLFLVSMAMISMLSVAQAAKEPMTITVEASNYAEPGKVSSGPVRIATNSESTRTITVPGNGQPKATTPRPSTFSYTAYYPASFAKARAPLEKVDALTNFINNYNKNITRQQANTIAEAIMEFSTHYNLDPRLVTSILAVESSFRTDAVSSSGAIGLGQLKPATASWLGVANPYDPIDNIAGATRYLAWLTQKYNGSYDHAVSAYYQGQGTIDRNGITEACLPYLMKINTVLSRF